MRLYSNWQRGRFQKPNGIGSSPIRRTNILLATVVCLILSLPTVAKPAKDFRVFPVKFTKITSKFSNSRYHPISKRRKPHTGTDFAAPRGTTVHVTGPGKVVESGYTRENGNYVFVQHKHDVMTKYLHLKKCKVKVGEKVDKSEVIGTVGSTGLATGPHLHYEILIAGIPYNPLVIFQEGLPKV